MTRRQWLEREARVLTDGIDKAEALIAELRERLKDVKDALAECGDDA